MGPKSRGVVCYNHRRSIPICILALTSLVLIGAVTLIVWPHACHPPSFLPLLQRVCLPELDFVIPLLVALGFWGIGLAIWLANRPDPPVEFFLLVAGVLAAGLWSSLGDPTGKRLFYLLLAWLAPLVFHFHHGLLGRSWDRFDQISLGLLYGLTIAWSLPLVIWDIPTLRQQGAWSGLQIGIRLHFTLAAILALLLIFRDYRWKTSPMVRHQVRLVAFGTLFAFAPLLLLSILPDTLEAPVYLPYEWTFPWLLLSPLSYAYSLFRHRLVRTDVRLNRAAVYYLLITLFLTAYLLIAAVPTSFLILSTPGWSLTGALLSVALLLLFAPLKQELSKFTNWILYGEEVSYAQAVSPLADALALVLDYETLQALLVHNLVRTLRSSGGLLFLNKDDQGLIRVAASGCFVGTETPDHLSPAGRLAGQLKIAGRPVHRLDMHRSLRIATLQPGEQQLLTLNQVVFWLPLVSGDDLLHGVLLMGPKIDQEFFTGEDTRILTTLARQAGLTAHNVRLAHQVWASRQELSQAYRQLLTAREQERRELAYQLHDDTIQPLLGVTYQLAQSRELTGEAPYAGAPVTEQLRLLLVAAEDEILEMVEKLRDLVAELRPAGLDDLGLPGALAGYVASLRREDGLEGPRLEVNLAPIGRLLSEPVAICLFRIAQEALRNALKHARAGQVRLDLCLAPDEVILRIGDDGCGFQVPDRLSEFTQTNHFGLANMHERISWIGGALTIQSAPGRGAEVVARVPLKQP